MNRNMIKEILYIMITVIVSVLAVKFVIWLFPIILVIIFGLLIYSSIKRNKRDEEIKKQRKEKNMKEVFDYKEKK